MDVPAPAPPGLGPASSSLPGDRSVPWRRAAIVTATIAVVELVVLLVIALAFLAKPFADDAAERAAGEATTQAAEAGATDQPAPTPGLPRSKTPILVLNGNGIGGAAATAAADLKQLGYPVTKVGDASRRDFPRTIVMYPPGLQGEAERLARDLELGKSHAVPLDGMQPDELRRAKLVLVIGG